MKNNKAPGESGIPPEAIKALGDQSLEYVTKLLHQYWINPDITHPEWQEANLTWLYKKGDRKDVSNYRGIALQDVFARLLSTIITK